MNRVLKKIACIMLIIAILCMNITTVFAASSEDIANTLINSAKRAVSEHNMKYADALAAIISNIDGDDWESYLKGAANGEEVNETIRQNVRAIIQEEYDKAIAGETPNKPNPTPGMTEEQQKEVEDAVSDWIKLNKKNVNTVKTYEVYITALEGQIATNPSGYTQEQLEYRKQLYTAELNDAKAQLAILKAEESFDAEAYKKSLEGLTSSQIQDEIDKLNSRLAFLQNMPSSYTENGKTRDELIAETKSKLSIAIQAKANAKNEEATGGLLGDSNASASHTPDEIINEAQNFLQQGGTKTTINGTNLMLGSSTLYNILLSIGILAAVIIGVYLGVKFMVSTAEDKAKVKEALIPYIAGCVIIFSAFIIWKLAITLLGGID